MSNEDFMKLVLSELKELKQGQANTNQRLNKLEQGQDKLETKVDAIQADVSAIQADVSAIQADVDAIQADVSAIQADVSGLRKEHADHADLTGVVYKQVCLLTDKNTAFDKKFESIKQAFSS